MSIIVASSCIFFFSLADRYCSLYCSYFHVLLFVERPLLTKLDQYLEEVILFSAIGYDARKKQLSAFTTPHVQYVR